MRLDCQRSSDGLEEYLRHKQRFTTADFEAAERRLTSRFSNRLPARVWGVDSEHEAFGLDCTIENISSTGVYLTNPYRMKSASQVGLIVHLLHGPDGGATAAIRGKVLRNEAQSDDRYGVAIEISDYQFL